MASATPHCLRLLVHWAPDGAFLGLAQRRQQHGRQDRNNGNDHKKFDQRKASCPQEKAPRPIAPYGVLHNETIIADYRETGNKIEQTPKLQNSHLRPLSGAYRLGAKAINSR